MPKNGGLRAQISAFPRPQQPKQPGQKKKAPCAPKRKARAPPAKKAGAIQTKTKQAKKNGGHVSAMRHYKIAASDAPSRVEKCELVRSFTYRAPASIIMSPPPEGDLGYPNLMGEEFGGQTLFLFLPQYAHHILMALDVPSITSSIVIQDYGNPGTSTASVLRIGTTPPMSTFNDTSEHARCMAINGTLVLQTEFGNCNGILRWKRYTLRDSHRTPGELLEELKNGVQGVHRKTLSGADTTVMHAGVQNKNHLSQYTEVLSNHWGYHPNDDADAADKGLSPLSGWIFTITNISATAFMPAPTMHIGAQVRVQRELTMSNAFLTDNAKPIDPDQLSHFKRNEEATQSFRGKVDDLRAAADAATALGTAAMTMMRLRQAARAA